MSKELKIAGKIVKILPIETGVSKADKEWKKQQFTINTGAEWNPECTFSMFGDDKIQMLSKCSEGQEVEVAFNISSREFNGKFYHNLDCWKIDPTGSTSAPEIGNQQGDDGSGLPF